jgi:DNA-binding GntR family transcriptional regulator
MVSSQRTRREQAYLEIKRRIVHGEFGPGMPLSESKLAELLRASRTPVREALSRLIEERYVERVPGRGYSVAPVTVELIQNLFEVRRLLEGAAASRAAEQGDAAVVQRLRAVTAFEYRPHDPASFRSATEANAAFHLEVARASGNALFVDLVRHCLDQVTRLIALGVDYEPLQESASEEHRSVVEAIEKRDPQGAQEAMEKHLDGSSQRMMEALVRGGVRAVTV